MATSSVAAFDDLSPEAPKTLELMRHIDELHLAWTWMDSRSIRDQHVRTGCPICRDRARRLMRKMGMHTIYLLPRTSLWLPEILNTDQSSLFNGSAFTDWLKDTAVRSSMGCKGRWLDNEFIERLWRSFYNSIRTHQALGSQTPDEVYCETSGLREAA